MTQNDCFGYVNLWTAFVKIILWLLPFWDDNWGSAIVSCYLENRINTLGFHIFSEGTEMEHWLEMG